MSNRASSNPCTAAFADHHLHGIAGVDFATSPVADIRTALALLATRRTTTVTASIPTVEVTALPAIFDRLRPFIRDELLVGVHLEGPFIAADYAGAHPAHAVLSPDTARGTDFVEAVLEQQSMRPTVTMMTVAPEVAGFEQLVEQLVNHGIAVALGHTGATYRQMRRGIDIVHGLTGRPVVITHAYNAMRGFHHRDPGPLLAVIEAARANTVMVELIADGHHVDLHLIRWWFETHPGVVRLVSDASAATLPNGRVPLTAHAPRLGHATLRYPAAGGPMLADGGTLASGGKDLLAIHDALVADGFEHQLICAAMQPRQ